MKERIMFLFTMDEISRIRSTIQENGTHILTVDLHGLRVKEAIKFLKNLIAADKEGYDICVIHGYLHGTAIKEAIYKQKISNRISKKYCCNGNCGMTYLKLVAS